MEKWRLKAIEILEAEKDPDLQNAISALKNGQGYLTTIFPIRIIFYEDMSENDCDAVE